jgi:serine/threonine-protein kinase
VFRVEGPEAPRVDPPTRLEDAPATTPEAAPDSPLPTTPEGAPGPELRADARLPASEPPEWRPGETVAGLYRIAELLGQGGMGRVYRARHKSWDLDRG